MSPTKWKKPINLQIHENEKKCTKVVTGDSMIRLVEGNRLQTVLVVRLINEMRMTM